VGPLKEVEARYQLCANISMTANFETDSPVGDMALHVALNALHSLPKDERMPVSAGSIANDVEYCEH
jgi:hypothetical protein